MYKRQVSVNVIDFDGIFDATEFRGASRMGWFQIEDIIALGHAAGLFNPPICCSTQFFQLGRTEDALNPNKSVLMIRFNLIGGEHG